MWEQYDLFDPTNSNGLTEPYLQVYVNKKAKQKIFAIENFSRTVMDDPKVLWENQIHHY